MVGLLYPNIVMLLRSFGNEIMEDNNTSVVTLMNTSLVRLVSVSINEWQGELPFVH